MNRLSVWLLFIFCVNVANVNAGGLGRTLARGAVRGLARSAERSAVRSTERQAVRRAAAIQSKDLWNHLHTPARPLPAPRTVYRYTSPSQVRRELHSGIAPESHMTATAPVGRPPSPATAVRKYGLPRTPGVRETVQLPRSFPVRHNKVPGGRQGIGEITSPRTVPRTAIKKVTPLR
jgi:hypothetical protein